MHQNKNFCFEVYRDAKIKSDGNARPRKLLNPFLFSVLSTEIRTRFARCNLQLFGLFTK
jgi:hypothetical protein